MLISIVTPTLNRPGPLRRALDSAIAQEPPKGASVEIVVVDNAPDGGARTIVEAAAARSRHPVRYVVEPTPGVASARNRGVGEARGDWIAFLDDDEEASPRWIRRMVESAEDGDADAVFGPVVVRAEAGADGADALLPFFARRLALPDGAEITASAARLGTNNAMFRRASCFPTTAPFDVRLDASGGEDSLLLARLARNGRRFVWSAGGVVTEWAPPRRLTWSYVRRRKFLSGQIRVTVLGMLEPPQRARMGLWMAVGGAQAVVMAALAALLWIPARNRAQRCLAAAAGGVGKILWMRPFRLALYGAGHVS